MKHISLWIPIAIACILTITLVFSQSTGKEPDATKKVSTQTSTNASPKVTTTTPTPDPDDSDKKATEKASPSVWSTLFQDPLINAKEEVVTPDFSGKYVGIYFSAHWCPPCRVFTPLLVDFQNKNASEFEVVFVSGDFNPKAQIEYMTETAMPWSAVRLASPDTERLQKEFNIKGFPTLIILDPAGRVVTDAGRMHVQMNPKTALQVWKDLAAEATKKSDSAK